jgi:cell division protease FtsH
MRAFRKAGSAFDADKNHAISESLARRVDEEIEKILNGGYDRAYDLLNRNRQTVKAIAEALLETEALEADELKELLARTGARA